MYSALIKRMHITPHVQVLLIHYLQWQIVIHKTLVNGRSGFLENFDNCCIHKNYGASRLLWANSTFDVFRAVKSCLWSFTNIHTQTVSCVLLMKAWPLRKLWRILVIFSASSTNPAEPPSSKPRSHKHINPQLSRSRFKKNQESTWCGQRSQKCRVVVEGTHRKRGRRLTVSGRLRTQTRESKLRRAISFRRRAPYQAGTPASNPTMRNQRAPPRIERICSLWTAFAIMHRFQKTSKCWPNSSQTHSIKGVITTT